METSRLGESAAPDLSKERRSENLCRNLEFSERRKTLARKATEEVGYNEGRPHEARSRKGKEVATRIHARHIQYITAAFEGVSGIRDIDVVVLLKIRREQFWKLWQKGIGSNLVAITAGQKEGRSTWSRTGDERGNR